MICGNAIITYEHIDPTFENSQNHNASRMTLLCGGHQLESSKDLLSKLSIKNADRFPYCKKSGHAKHLFDLGGQRPTILLGDNDFTQCGSRIVINGEVWFAVLPPERKSRIWRLSARFKNHDNKIICEIKENELLICAENSQVTQTANRFIISDSENVLLEMELQHPSVLVIKRYRFETDSGTIIIAEDLVPDFLNNTFPNKPVSQTKELTMTFESGNSRCVFLKNSFISPSGIDLQIKNGSIQFGGG